MRHVLFIVPIIAATLGVLCIEILKIPKIRVIGACILGLFSCLQAMDIARLHPYSYTYFNKLSGGLSSAGYRFESDYWGTAYREAIESLGEKIPRKKSQLPWRITMEPPLEQLVEIFGKPVVPHPALVEPFLRDDFILVGGHEKPEFYIATTRNRYNEMRAGDSVVSIHRDGITLAEVKWLGNNN